jgi:hypothetical protein
MEEVKEKIETTAAPPMRTWEEIQYAHDVFAGITENSSALAAMPEHFQVCTLMARSTLCWALGHPNGEDGFLLLLRTIVSYLEHAREVLEQVDQELPQS